MKNDCVFCQIAAGQQSARKVYEDESVVAFLSIRPVNPGHILVIPKNHVEEVLDMGQDLYEHTMNVVQQMMRTLKTKLQPDRVGIWVHGFEIPHAHIHVIPLHESDDIRARTKEATDEKLAEMAEKLKS